MEMNDKNITMPSIALLIDPECEESEQAKRLREKFSLQPVGSADMPVLHLSKDGLSLVSDGQVLMGDFSRLIPRLRPNNLSQELLVRAAKIKDAEGALHAVDATAGMGEDSFLLAAAGFHVRLYERNPVIFELLSDSLKRALEIPELASAAGRMQVFSDDSIEAMRKLPETPDVILLDPMFPERQKSSLVKKKLQMIQKLEMPCADENELVLAAMQAKPKKLIIKRPPKGPYLAGIKPDFSSSGKAVRFDCIVSPYERIEKFFKK